MAEPKHITDFITKLDNHVPMVILPLGISKDILARTIAEGLLLTGNAGIGGKQKGLYFLDYGWQDAGANAEHFIEGTLSKPGAVRDGETGFTQYWTLGTSVIFEITDAPLQTAGTPKISNMFREAQNNKDVLSKPFNKKHIQKIAANYFT